MLNIFQKVFGTSNERALKKFSPLVDKVNNLESQVVLLSDEDLKKRTPWLKDRLKKGETLDDILPDAFATMREAAKRVLHMRHFDVQILGGIILHRGMIAEMKTGEGKTVSATAPVYLNALTGQGVHVVTVNDYLVQRDADWMGEVYKFLGLSVGCIVSDMDEADRKAAYEADITHGTNNEFGFDYLRDNMKFYTEEMVQKKLNYAIVDEVDNILIDEARTPLIISGPAEDSSDLYATINELIPHLKEGDYEKDEKSNAVTLTEEGTQHMEDLVKGKDLLKGGGLYDINNVAVVHHINQALKAHKLFQKDRDYIVKEGEVVIIDEFTGRMSTGRRYSDGLHQALEAKERTQIQIENQTLASITFQNYFRLYNKLAGMTGSAETDADELSEIYKLDVAVLPTNKPMVRKDYDDEVYRTAQEKYESVISLVKECHLRQQPILLGTTSIEKSINISNLLKKHSIPHTVLNARYHEREADIIAGAGEPGAVTIATNMAGRGTDIKLGGSLEMRLKKELRGLEDSTKQRELTLEIEQDIAEKAELVKKAGGLYVIGTERHESRRIDNQLRGRSGRQGDPGASKFFLSLEDDLMRIFGSEKMDALLQKLGLEEGESITHAWVNKALERAQQKIEGRNFDIRKQLLRFDDVMNDQRKVIYAQRRDLMEAEDISETIEEMTNSLLEDTVQANIPPGSLPEEWKINSLKEECKRIFNLDVPVDTWAQEEGVADVEIMDRLKESLHKLFQKKEEMYGKEMLRVVEKNFLLRVLDHSWKDHLLSLDHLRQGIHLRAYGQRDPLNEYKSEAFILFQGMLDHMREPLTLMLTHFEMESSMDKDAVAHTILDDEESRNIQESRQDVAETGVQEKDPGIHVLAGSQITSSGQAISRNALCPCGSDKRYKHCHGR